MEPEGDALRRADLGAGPRDDQGGPRRDGRPRQGRHDDGRGHPRDGLRPYGGRPGRLHGRRRRSSRRTPPRSSSPTRAPTAPRTSSARSSSTDRPAHARVTTAETKEMNHATQAAPKAVLAAAGLASHERLAACGDAGSDDEDSVEVEAEEDAAGKFEEGTRMAELADAGKITIGVKFDQPGLGFKDASDDVPTGFDLEMAKLLVADLGIDPESTGHVEGDDLRQPRAVPRRTASRPGARVVLHHRRASRGRRPGRAVLRHRPAGAGRRRQRHQEHRRPQGQGGLLGDRLHLAGERRGRGRQAAPADTYSQCAEDVLNGSVDGDVDRRLDPARPTPRRTRDELKVVGDAFSEERIGVGYSKDHPEMCQWINDVLDRGLRRRLLGRGLRGHARRSRTSRRPSRPRSTSAPA